MQLVIKYDQATQKYAVFAPNASLCGEPLGIGKSPDEAVGMAVRRELLQTDSGVTVDDIRHERTDTQQIPQAASTGEQKPVVVGVSRQLSRAYANLRWLQELADNYERLYKLAKKSETAFPEVVAALGDVIRDAVTLQQPLIALLATVAQKPEATPEPAAANCESLRRICAMCGKPYDDRDQPMSVYPKCPSCTPALG